LFLLIRSRLFDVCPNTNPTLIGLNVILGFGTNGGMPWSNCGSYLENVDCVGGLGYVAPFSTGSVYNPTNTPVPGTQTLFDDPGEMSTPVSGSVFTWVAYQSAYQYVVTALSEGKSVLATTTAVGGASATGSVVTITGTTRTGAAGSTSTGSGNSGGTTKNAARGLQPEVPVAIGSAVVLGIYLFL
jgi:hypothetical protein